jgi:O-antigen/teichoic acid export membrane protein
MPRRTAFLSDVTARLGQVRARVGDLWWFMVLFFAAQRMADVVNAAVGLWLVPKYITVGELGAVLPLASVGTMLALPLSFIALPLLKFLNQYIREEAFGQAKRLLRDTLILASGLLIVLLALSPIVMPAVFTRMRVESGSLSILILTSGVMTVLTPIFLIMLQAQKMFRAITLLTLVMAVTRLGVMSVCLPIRGLSGYFVGQIVPSLLFFAAALFFSRQILGRKVKSEPYLAKDGLAILRYSIAPVAFSLFTTFAGTVQAFVIRRCLPDIDSAAYYMLMRFADIALTIGMTCALILFPLAAEENSANVKSPRLLLHALTIPLAGGAVFTLVATPIVWLLFRHIAAWSCYLPYLPHLAALCLTCAAGGAIHCYFTFQCARGVFKFIPFFCILLAVEGVFFYAFTGYTFFAPWLPPAWMEALTAFNPCRLSVVIGISILFNLLLLAYIFVDLFKARTQR